MKKQAIASLLIIVLMTLNLGLHAQNPENENSGRSLNSYEESFQNLIKSDKRLIEKVKAKSLEHVTKMGKTLGLDKTQQDSLLIVYTDFVLHMDFSADSISNAEERFQFNNAAFVRYQAKTNLIYTEDQRVILNDHLEKKANEKNFTPYIRLRKNIRGCFCAV